MKKLTPTMQAFIVHWGEMGSRWGINRTVAQIHALLLLSPDPLDAGTIAESLSVARSNVSNSLRVLQGYGVIRVTQSIGDPRDRFEATKDSWEMFGLIVDERKKRECDPTVATLRELTANAKDCEAEDVYAQERLAEILEFYETITAWYTQMRRMPTKSMIRLVKMGDKILKFLSRA